MNDIFKDMQAKVGCEYISDLPSYKQMCIRDRRTRDRRLPLRKNQKSQKNPKHHRHQKSLADRATVPKRAITPTFDCFFRTQKGVIDLCVRFGIKDTVSEPATSTLSTTCLLYTSERFSRPAFEVFSRKESPLLLSSV